MSKSDPMAQMPEQFKEFAEKSVSEARKAMDEFLKNATTTMSDMDARSEKLREGTTAINRQAMAFAEDNIKSAFDVAERMVAADSAEKLLKIQQEYFTERMEAMSKQAKELGDAASKTAGVAMKPKS